MLYLSSNTRTDISFGVHQYSHFTHNNKVSHYTAVKSICCNLHGTKDDILVFNPPKKILVDCYVDADFAGLWWHENPQDYIFARIRTGLVVPFSNFTLLWVSKLQRYIDISTLHSEYVASSHSIIDLLPLKILIKEFILNLIIDSEKLWFVSSSTVYEDNNGSIVVETSPRMTPTSKHIF